MKKECNYCPSKKALAVIVYQDGVRPVYACPKCRKMLKKAFR